MPCRPYSFAGERKERRQKMNCALLARDCVYRKHSHQSKKHTKKRARRGGGRFNSGEHRKNDQ